MPTFGNTLFSELNGPKALVDQAGASEQAGFEFLDEVCVVQVCDDKDGFFRFWTDELAPRLAMAAG